MTKLKRRSTITYLKDFTPPIELWEHVSQQGFDILPELIRIVVNAAMQAERQQYLKAEPYQRTPEREGYANDYKPKAIQTREGDITFSVRKSACATGVRMI